MPKRKEHITHSGRQYQLHPFKNEQELETLLDTHTKEVFGPQTIFFSPKKVVHTSDKTLLTIPDGYLINLQDPQAPSFALIEAELASHDAYKHIMVQMAKFSEIDAESRLKIRNTLLPLLESELPKIKNSVSSDQKLPDFWNSATTLLDHLLLKDLKKRLPSIVVIDKVTVKLQQALIKLKYKPEVMQVKQYTAKSGESSIHVSTFNLKTAMAVSQEAAKEKNNNNQDFDFSMNNIKISITAQDDNTYRYIRECSYTPHRSFIHPITFTLEAHEPEAKLKLIKTKNYVVQGRQHQTNRLIVETDFQTPLKYEQPIDAYLEVETKSQALPPHIGESSLAPITGDLEFNVDLSNITQPNQTRIAKLLEFSSKKASRPIISGSLAPVKEFKNGKLHWKIEKPKQNHYYMIIWEEPCNCDLCRQKNML